MMLSFVRRQVSKLLTDYNWRDLICIVLFSYAATFFIRKGFDFEIRRYWGIAFILIFVIVVFGFANQHRKNYTGRLFLFSTVPFILFAIYYWFLNAFGSFDLGAIQHHMQMGIEGGAEGDVIKLGLIYSALAVLFLITLHYLAKRDMRIVWADRIVALPLLVISPLLLNIVDYYRYSDEANELMKHYSELPDDLKLPEGVKPKNLIVIYAESMERTYEKLANGKTVLDPVNALASQGVTIEGLTQATNTGWTMAGIVSSQCGVPLQPNGLFAENNFDKHTTFMPSAVCLGDILQNNGYQAAYINGGSVKFAGADLFLGGHGFSAMYGVDDYVGQWEDYRNYWGLYDDTMFDLALGKLSELSASDQPYFFAITTVSAHFPSGHPTRRCIAELGPIEGPEILYAVRCQAYEIAYFLERARADGFIDDNTLVVIASDHFLMQTEITSELKTHERSHFFTILGMDRPAEVIEKKGSSFDIYPTLLEALGFEVPNHQASLGISLLSDRPTLQETLGQERLNSLIKHDRLLGTYLWQNPDADKMTAVIDNKTQ